MDRFTVTPHVFYAARNDRYLAAKEYVPRREASAVPRGCPLTLVMMHAAGFFKEIWEPVLATLPLDNRPTNLPADLGNVPECISFVNSRGYAAAVLDSRPIQRNEWHVERIMALDAWNHGDSSALNRDKLGRKFSWMSAAQDIIDVARQLGTGSTLVGVGHSLGGSSMLIAQLLQPGLFDALFAVEPVLAFSRELHDINFEHVLKRRRTWAKQADIHKYFASHRFYDTWDPRAKETFTRYGLHPIEIPAADGKPDTPGFTLKCHPRDEYECFQAGQVDSVWTRDHVSEIISPTRFLMGGLSSCCPNAHFARAHASAALLSDARVAKGLGHLLVIESPATVSRELGQFLNDLTNLQSALQPRAQL
ncbi:hypothetical protein IWQ60_004410 [Tieghemiomyces parasiticus]|uniref:AB hydrolase-1 domain-containing protein n=1 Tax=Tieghemiomyces parasiticus TaxID=78921 RepID=A0A9W8AFX0_9FUNG|nr:hypothetical protein IWQ60_004410 [Tieghemiomyces parasiticus]